jgi:Cellulose binding domain/Carbohydrate binding module (family 35)/PQQ-like domain
MHTIKMGHYAKWVMFVLIVCSLITSAENFQGKPALAATSASEYDWPQFGLNEEKSADNTLETTINLSNVAKLTPLFHVPLPSSPDGAPVLLTNVSTPSGVRDLVFVTTELGGLIAMDAHTGAQVWSHSFYAGSGITNSAPAIDPNREYIYSPGVGDGLVHKVNVGNGTEVTGGGWPEQIGPAADKASSELSIATAKNGVTYLYASQSYGLGHETVINLATGSKHVFNTVCANQPDVLFDAPGQPNNCTLSGAEPWSRPGAVYDPDLDKSFVMTGTYTQFQAGIDWVQSLLALPPDGHTTLENGGGYPLDSYTPSDWAASVAADQDIGSSNIIILPTNPKSKYPYLGVSGGKDAKLRLYNLANLSGKGGPGNLGGELAIYNAPQGGLVRSEGASWINPADGSTWIFVPGDNGISGMQYVVDSAGNPSLVTRWIVKNGWTTSAIVANGVLFAAVGGGEHTATTATHTMQAINPTTGAIVWSAPIGQFHWASPIVANGVLYMPDGNAGEPFPNATGDLNAWALPTTISSSSSYEAESSANTLAGGAVVAACSGCSGGSKVGYVGDGGTLQFNGVQATSAGTYTLTIYYIDGDTGRTAQMSVNGGAATTLTFHGTNDSNWNVVQSLTVPVQLNAGSNTIKFSNASAPAPDFDRITLTPTSSPTPTPTPTSNPTPTPTVGTTPTPSPTPTVGTTPTPTPTATPSSGGTCKVNYSVQSQWTGGFTSNIIITNTSTTALTSWSLQFSFPNGQQVTEGWDGTFSQQGSQVTVQNLSYNGSLAASGGSTSLGFNGSWTASNANPTSFTLNGTMCSTS